MSVYAHVHMGACVRVMNVNTQRPEDNPQYHLQENYAPPLGRVSHWSEADQLGEKDWISKSQGSSSLSHLW